MNRLLFSALLMLSLIWEGSFFFIKHLLDINAHSIVSVDIVGFICMLAATLCYATGSRLSKRLKGVTMYQTTFGTLLCAMIGSGTIVFSIEPVNLNHFASLTNIGLVIGLGVFVSSRKRSRFEMPSAGFRR